jgi:hypothetical protein
MSMAENKSRIKFNPPSKDVIQSIQNSGDNLSKDGKMIGNYIQRTHWVNPGTTLIVSKLHTSQKIIDKLVNGPLAQYDFKIDEQLENIVFRTEYLVTKRRRNKFDLRTRNFFIDNTIIPEVNTIKVKHDELSKKKQRKLKKQRMKFQKVSDIEAKRLSEDLKTVV